MEFLNLAKERYSVRKFEDKALKDEDIKKILEAGIVAPTAHNKNPERIYVIKSEAALEKLAKCTRCSYGTKTAFLVAYDKTESWKREFDGADSGEVDASIVSTHMMLEAASIGIGSTWVMWFDPEIARNEFELEENIIPVSILVMGYPAKDAAPSNYHTNRKTTDEIVTLL